MNVSKSGYKLQLRHLQIELVKLQRHIIQHNHRILIIFEGRDASGKDGVIKRINWKMSVLHQVNGYLSPTKTLVMSISRSMLSLL